MWACRCSWSFAELLRWMRSMQLSASWEFRIMMYSRHLRCTGGEHNLMVTKTMESMGMESTSRAAHGQHMGHWWLTPHCWVENHIFFQGSVVSTSHVIQSGCDRYSYPIIRVHTVKKGCQTNHSRWLQKGETVFPPTDHEEDYG